MRTQALRFTTLLPAGLLAGAVVLNWLIDQALVDPSLYIAFKQAED